MAAVSSAVCLRLLLVAVAVLASVPASSQQQPITTRVITDPGFPCGVPWGPNGERPTEAVRSKRQIIFPGDDDYKKYVAILLSDKGTIVTPRDPTSDAVTDPAEPTETLQSFCGTVVITDRFLLTAAHCTIDENNPISAVRLGDLDLGTDDEANSRARTYDIMEIIRHPNFRPDQRVRYNDLALLLTFDTIQFNDIVFPRCIPDSPPAPGDIVTASGFGRYNATFTSTHQLEANFTIVATKECENEYVKRGLDVTLRVQYPVLLQNTDIICAIDDVSDSCEGDSGGPVTQVRDGKEYLVALVSTGPSCVVNQKSVLPGFYLSIAHHVRFISDVVFGAFGPIPPPRKAL